MRNSSFALLAFLARGMLLPGTELVAQHAVQLRNGDRITGRVREVSGSNWVIRYRGADISVPSDQVSWFATSEPVGVRLKDGTVDAFTVSRTEGDSLLLVSPSGATRRVTPSDIAAIGPATDLERLRNLARVGLFSPILDFWRASGAVGFSNKSGNSRARGLALSLDLERKTPKDRITVSLGLNRESSQPPGGSFQTTVEKYYAAARTDIYLGPAFFLFGQTRQEKDRFQDIDLRSTYGAGLGLQLLSTAVTDLNLSASLGLRREAYVSGGSDATSVASAGYALAQALGPARFSWRAEWTPSLQDLGDYRLRSEASVTTTIYAGLGLRVGVINEVNNRPRPGVKRHDMLLSTTVTYSIGR
ncbi:hypothetical protein HRbin33_00119 [bacterium HR33]|nr:hypothetical protein HRbin33_00119 [bacterium HR33]